MRYDQALRLRTSLYSCLRAKEETRYPRGSWRVEAPYFSAWRVLRGEAELETESGGSGVAGSGQWLVGPPGNRRQRMSADIRMHSVAFLAEWASGAPLYREGLPAVLPADDLPELDRIVLDMDRAIERAVPGHPFGLSGEELSLEAFLDVQRFLPEFLRDLMAGLRRIGITPTGEPDLDPRVRRALAVLEGLPLDHSLTLSELAAEAGTSRSQLERLFSRDVGRTPRQHFQQRRLRVAEEALGRPGVRIKEVAYRLGFDTPGHFTRWFRRYRQTTPRAYAASRHLGPGE